jgi:hypothetical protein
VRAGSAPALVHNGGSYFTGHADSDGDLIGIEVRDARSKLPRHVLDSARGLDAGEV